MTPDPPLAPLTMFEQKMGLLNRKLKQHMIEYVAAHKKQEAYRKNRKKYTLKERQAREELV